MFQDLWHIDTTGRKLAPILLITFLDVRPGSQWCDSLGIQIEVAFGVLWS